MSDDSFKEPAASYEVEPKRSEFAPLIDELYRERVLRARSASPENKILAGQPLFESACEITLLGIRHDFPEYTEEQCRQVLRDRLAMRRKHERKHDSH
ncbi:MAG: hypothetical protein ABIR24_12015 [Verrucomicrobiota bacterium]